MPFSEISTDILLEVMKDLQIQDILATRSTCKFLRDLTYSKTLWLHILESHVFKQGVPTPLYHRFLAQLPSVECEAFVTHALKNHKQFTSCEGGNNCPRTLLHLPMSVSWVQLLRHRWLLTASSDQTRSVLTLWKLSYTDGSDHSVERVACLPLPAPVKAGHIDYEDNDVIIAIEVRGEFDTSTIVLTLAQTGGQTGFAHIAAFPGLSYLRAVHGSRLAAGVLYEVNIPCVVDWRSGAVVRLEHAPDAQGSAVAMAMHQDLVVVVTPHAIKCFSVSFDRVSSQWSQFLCSLPIPYSVGFADAKFVRSVDGDGSAWHLRVCISGEGGLYLFNIPESSLLSGNPRSLDTLFSRRIPPEVADQWVHETPDVPLAFVPVIDASGTFSWIEGVSHDVSKPLSFCSTSHFALNGPENEDCTPRHLRFLDRDLPALYAMGVYDYDPGLGLAVFGNYYGELVLYNLGRAPLSKLEKCLQEVNLSDRPLQGTLEDSTSATSFGFPFPYCGPLCPPDDVPESLRHFWLSQPDTPRRFGGYLVPIANVNSRSRWAKFTRRLPDGPVGFAWILENAYHLLGTPVCFLYNHTEEKDLIRIGGLVFKIWTDEIVVVVQPGLSPQDCVDREEAYAPFDVTELDFDQIAELWGRGALSMWKVETRSGRNRWEEMKERGGDVDPSLLRLGSPEKRTAF